MSTLKKLVLISREWNLPGAENGEQVRSIIQREINQLESSQTCLKSSEEDLEGRLRACMITDDIAEKYPVPPAYEEAKGRLSRLNFDVPKEYVLCV